MSLAHFAYDHANGRTNSTTPIEGAYIEKDTEKLVKVDFTEGKPLAERLLKTPQIAIFINYPSQTPPWVGVSSKPHPFRMESPHYTCKTPERVTVRVKADTLEECARLVLDQRREAIRVREEMTPAKELAMRLKHHDWHYQMSDDHRWYTAGHSSWAKIKGLLKSLDPEEARAVWAENAPEGRSCPV